MQTKSLRAPWPRWSRILSFGLLVITVAFIFSNSMETAAESTVKSESALGLLQMLLQQLPDWFTEYFLPSFSQKTAAFFLTSLLGVPPLTGRE